VVFSVKPSPISHNVPPSKDWAEVFASEAMPWLLLPSASECKEQAKHDDRHRGNILIWKLILKYGTCGSESGLMRTAKIGADFDWGLGTAECASDKYQF